jgi:6-pyruvoyl-tetrahydropterin synthase
MMNAPDKTLDEMGFVIDFGELKPIVKQVVDFFDHTYMVSVANIDAKCPYYKAAGAGSRDVSLVPVMQSSAELLAAFFKEAIQENLVSHGHADVAVTEVAVWETAKNCARA